MGPLCYLAVPNKAQYTHMEMSQKKDRREDREDKEREREEREREIGEVSLPPYRPQKPLAVSSTTVTRSVTVTSTATAGQTHHCLLGGAGGRNYAL